MRVQYAFMPDRTTHQAEHVLGPAVSFITWNELFEALRASGIISMGEHVPSFQTDDRGITFTLAERPDK